ncbi:MAG: transcriptional regulator NrdR [Candidatus Omnitrophica bacterium]|nr:transcriptional regulator NrdR [Candidatus Omnitrophota bacterium]MBU4479006.1 transcriptional regulator NrdR [Candidatus Omnitrophota bacterium]MCG2703801.1 transcriptional regulator NrdR [Candidatus Omnitrophota bacterium]MCG2711300.1 transcriptional regulator NrdR [Candidatus Omnitrophota bacterium]
MKCPFCANIEDKVVDSRISSEGDSIRRRRECLKCQRRFTTYEYIEKTMLMIIKKDGRREPFDRNKILSGLLRACEKRPVSMETVEGVVDSIECTLQKNYDKEVVSSDIGELVMQHLHDIDEVAYVRFASVYRQFKDINQFLGELKDLLNKRRA